MNPPSPPCPAATPETLCGVAWEHKEQQHIAESLAKSLKSPCFAAERLASYRQTGATLLLVRTFERLELRDLANSKSTPHHVDFIDSAMGRRWRQGLSPRELLARAVGVRGAHRPTILDATAGWGMDAFLLAALGCRVTMVERSPVVTALLKDGMRRALNQGNQAMRALMERLTLIHGESRQVLDPAQSETPWITTQAVAETGEMMEQAKPVGPVDAIYLDPMFPAKSKQARSKKALHLLQQLSGHGNQESDALLKAALACGVERVVVKRPPKGPLLNGPRPSFQLQKKLVRLDIYQTSRSGTTRE